MREGWRVEGGGRGDGSEGGMKSQREGRGDKGVREGGREGEGIHEEGHSDQAIE